MNFFDYEGNSFRTSPNLWMFFAVSIPLTLLAFLYRKHFARPASDSFDLESAEGSKSMARAYTYPGR